MSTSNLKVMPVACLTGKQFFIPSYQRGYRWTKEQAIQLLEDLDEFNGRLHYASEFYCLQPVVVRARGNDEWEVIDGQQRLTTLKIILKCLKSFIPSLELPSYSICYETRETSADFLEHIDTKTEEQAQGNIDYYHMYQVYQAVKEWLKANPGSLYCLLQLLAEESEQRINARIIWYEVSQETDAIDVFSRLNIGKIPLTESELIKALFLRRGNFSDEAASTDQIILATEWDNIERRLRRADFWGFLLPNKKGSQYSNRIDLIFSLLAEQAGEGKKKPHLWYEERLRGGEESVSQLWLEVKDCFRHLEECYQDHTCYHYVGYLTIGLGVGLADILRLKRGKGRSAFVDSLKGEVRSRLSLSRDKFNGLSYEEDKDAIRRVLLLFNIATILGGDKSDMRFPFDRYQEDQWDIEHIRSRAGDSRRSHSQKVAVLEDIKAYLASVPKCSDDEKALLDEVKHTLQLLKDNKPADDKDFEECWSGPLRLIGELEEFDGVDGLGNLTLLDSHTNRSYGNSPFVIKRARIISNDKQGIWAPPTTRNVFLKYYSKSVGNALAWTKRDAQDYMNEIDQVLTDFITE